MAVFVEHKFFYLTSTIKTSTRKLKVILTSTWEMVLKGKRFRSFCKFSYHPLTLFVIGNFLEVNFSTGKYFFLWLGWHQRERDRREQEEGTFYTRDVILNFPLFWWPFTVSFLAASPFYILLLRGVRKNRYWMVSGKHIEHKAKM